MGRKEEATLLLKIKESGQGALKGVKGIFDRIVITAGDVVNAFRSVVNAGLDMVKLQGESESVRKAFRNLAAAQGQDAQKMLNNMRELSIGTVSDLQLMKNANQALLLGLPVDRFGDMLTVARSASKATGESMEYMLNSIVTGLGRGSKLILDNLGIMIDVNKAYEKYAANLGTTADKLNDAQRKQAFINEALNVGVENARKIGDANVTLAERVQQAQARFENFKETLANGLKPVMVGMFQTFEDLTSAFGKAGNAGQMVIGLFEKMTLGANVLVNEFVALGQKIGIFTAGLVEATTALIKGNLSRAKEIMLEQYAEQLRVQEEAQNKSIELARQMEEAKRQQQAEDHQAMLDQQQQQEEDKKAADMEKMMTDMEDKFQLESEIKASQHDIRMAELENKEAAIIQAELRALNARIANEKDFHAKRKLLEQKAATESKLQTQQLADAKLKIEETERKQRLSDQRSTFAAMSSLSQSNNRTLIAIGKAAAIANISISTAEGIARALGAFPPPINFGFAAAVGAAGAVQAARIAGVQFAEGGIVAPRSGGIQATIGEGGRPEGVFPLPDDFDPDNPNLGGNNFIFSGPVLGDKTQAVEFARMIDQELYNLRRRNESIAFDEALN